MTNLLSFSRPPKNSPRHPARSIVQWSYYGFLLMALFVVTLQKAYGTLAATYFTQCTSCIPSTGDLSCSRETISSTPSG